MATISTNIIQNVYSLGGSSSCDAGTSYCSEGYVLYFPCLKDITKGQSVCCEFYVADSSTQDVIDLRDVDAITLELTGAFGCSFGTFSYPDNISSLQTEEYPVVYSNDFGQRTLCHLNLDAVDTSKTEDVYINTKESDFYSGTSVELEAFDTPTHIFIGWAKFNDDEEECAEETWSDLIISTESKYTFTIEKDTVILALYRPRKTYKIVADENNKSSHFVVDYDHSKYFISNRPDEVFDDGYDTIDEVVEGYHMVACCHPAHWLDDSESGDEGYSYVFKSWKDGNTDRCRLFCVGQDTQKFEDGDTIKLYAFCNERVPVYDIVDDDIIYIDSFDEDGIHINTEFTEESESEYTGDDYTVSSNNVTLKYIEEEGFLHFNNGTLVLSSMDITDGIKISIQAKSEEGCNIVVSVNGLDMSQELSGDEFKMYEFYFHECDGSNITITTDGDCLVDIIEVCSETIIDKGKAQLCLDSETTANLPSGDLYVSGAIMVNGSSYGLASTQIGKINKLSKITITQ